jgi:hypothetical protein
MAEVFRVFQHSPLEDACTLPGLAHGHFFQNSFQLLILITLIILITYSNAVPQASIYREIIAAP